MYCTVLYSMYLVSWCTMYIQSLLVWLARALARYYCALTDCALRLRVLDRRTWNWKFQLEFQVPSSFHVLTGLAFAFFLLLRCATFVWISWTSASFLHSNILEIEFALFVQLPSPAILTWILLITWWLCSCQSINIIVEPVPNMEVFPAVDVMTIITALKTSGSSKSLWHKVELHCKGREEIVL